jgi:N-acetylmuramoyl-L-alanine amidase
MHGPLLPAPLICLSLVVGLLAGCGTVPGGPTGDYEWLPSPNFNARRPNYVILHQTSNDDAATALRTLTNPLKSVSAHYLISRDGHVVQLVSEAARAWHAGASWWGGLTDLNSASIGIELDNNGEEAILDAQIAALLPLLADLKARYRIPTANFIGHADVAPRRKADPSWFFPWQRLAGAGFGLWCTPGEGPPAPPGFDAQLGLQALGYDTRDPDAARLAFRRHFAGDDSQAQLTADDLSRLYCLLGKKHAAETF